MSRPTRLTLLCHGRTTAGPGGFPADEPLAEGEAERAAGLAHILSRNDEVLSSPGLAARQTAAALNNHYTVDSELRDIDFGLWKGRLLSEIAAAEPDVIDIWPSDPEATPHRGESIAALIARTDRWMAANLQGGTRRLLVTHPAVIKAMILAALAAPTHSFWKIDIAHLSLTELSSDGRRWAVRSMGLRTRHVRDLRP